MSATSNYLSQQGGAKPPFFLSLTEYKMFIAKIQKSLTYPSKMLIYNQSRIIISELALTEEVDKLMGDKLKVYARCKMLPTNQIEVVNLVKDQKW